MSEPAADDQPTAVRAVASTRESRLTRQPVRVCRYDALWPDGHIDYDVDLAKMMYRGQPADFHPIRIAVHDECPEVGAGAWIDNYGQVVDGPAPEDPDWVKPGLGRAIAYRKGGPSRTNWGLAASYAWRIGPGLAAIIIGLLLVIKIPGANAVAFLGVLCILFGLASMVSLVRNLRRRR